MPGIGIKAVGSQQRQLELIAVTKTGLGTPVLSGLCANFCSVVDNGVGDYTINVNTKRPGWQTVIASILMHQTGTCQKVVAGSDNLKIQIKTFAVDGTTPAEKDFDLLVIGSDAKDLLG